MGLAKRGFLGSAAALVAIGGAQAADPPVKAKPIEYVKVCNMYGAGYYAVPGTNTCLKIGMFIRYQHESESFSGGVQYTTTQLARFTRTDSPYLVHRVRTALTVDGRTQTEYGTLRTYIRVGAEQTYPLAGDQIVFFDRAFIQFAGFTVGRTDSFYDFFSNGRYNYTGNRVGSHMFAAFGQTVLGYTWQLGNGFSASLSIEDGGAAAAGNAGNNPAARGKVTVDLDNSPLGLGSFTLDNGSYAMPDIVANVRVDQPWGSAQIKGALHQNRGGYYSFVPGQPGCPSAILSNSVSCGHPEDKLGWAVGAGVMLNIPGMPGDSFGAEINYAEGATGYTTRSTQAWRSWGAGNSIGVGWATDSVFANATGLELTRSWGVIAGGEHRWNPQWRTSLYGGFESIEHNATAKALICSRASFSGLTASNCDPDVSWWQIGSRTQWNPHPYLDVGLDVQYLRLNTAFAGAGTVTVADGARPAGPVVIEDQGIVTWHFRVQYNFLP